jgi:uncharacterized protein (DUF58 family)
MPVNPVTLQNRAEALAARLPPLVLEAEKIAMTVAQGVHGLRRAGPGENFWQYRLYSPGDPASAIDWRRSGRSEDLFVRQNEREASQTVWLWADTSASMDYRSKKKYPSKVRRGTLLMLALIALLARGGEKFAIIASGMPPLRGKSGLYRASEYMHDETRQSRSLPPFYILPRHAQVVFIGDFLSPLKEVKSLIGMYAAHGIRGHMVQIVDPAEETLPFIGRVIFEGLEDEEDVEIKRVDSIKKDYARRFHGHCKGLAHLTRAAGWTYTMHRTDKPAEKALLELYMSLSILGAR